MPNSGRSAFSRKDDGCIKKTVVKIPSDTKYIKKVSSRVLGSLAPYGLGESDVFDIKLCVEEAVINAIIHGNRRDAKKSVTAAYWINGDELNVEVEDEGDGFVYKEISDPTAEGNIMKSSGRGVYLINHLMDKVEYNDAGNRIRMIKRLRHKKGN